MAQPVMTILSHQDAIAARAIKHTGDINEAGLLVFVVMGRAFARLSAEAADEVSSAELQQDLDRLIEARAAH